jgi:His-Xaa-Ser system radical SAM maturase HxsC
VVLPPELAYLAPGDVIGLSPDGTQISVLWRRASHQNSILLTERCDNYCLMCSQPPRERDDDWLLQRAFEVVRLLPPETTDVLFTGGEPTFYGHRLLDLLAETLGRLPAAQVHLLSNGRRFADGSYASAYAAVAEPRLMVGIPVYGAEEDLHDYVVQARGAFRETIRGILNLAERDQAVELRVVVHRLTAPKLVEIAEFIARNLPFVDQVALMGLEIMGLARANLGEIWIDPWDYRSELAEAAELLEAAHIRTYIFNHQLCLVDERVRHLAVSSISDWKNDYLPECDECDLRAQCGGFFTSAKYRRSAHIKPVHHDFTIAPEPRAGAGGAQEFGARVALRPRQGARTD